jgi:hypothetical protein
MYLHSLMYPEFIICSFSSPISSPCIIVIEFIIEIHLSLELYDFLNTFSQILHHPHYWHATNRPHPLSRVLFQFSLGFFTTPFYLVLHYKQSYLFLQVGTFYTSKVLFTLYQCLSFTC